MRVYSKIFEETGTESADALLSKYKSSIDDKSNDTYSSCILFSVAGGKLSEGINFSDNLARICIIVGLPYPNKNSTEMIEKCKYYDSLNSKLINGKKYYENWWWKVINQSIGRAIRHRNDYAAILLIDQRYTYDGIRDKLPTWISTRMPKIDNDASGTQSIKQLKEFFESVV